MSGFSAILCSDQDCGIGYQGRLPWHCTEELKFFSYITSFTLYENKLNAVIMGRQTWESLPLAHRPLSNRLNIVITSDPSTLVGTNHAAFMGVSNPEEAWTWVKDHQNVIDKTFVIGGAKLYTWAFHHPDCHKVYWTWIKPLSDEVKMVTCDTKVEHLPEHFKLLSSESASFAKYSLKFDLFSTNLSLNLTIHDHKDNKDNHNLNNQTLCDLP